MDVNVQVHFHLRSVVMLYLFTSQEKGPPPRPKTAGHGTFMLPYGSRTLDAAKLAEFRAQLAASLVPQPAAKG